MVRGTLAHIDRPYVIVGYSYGGLIVRLYASTYQDAVVSTAGGSGYDQPGAGTCWHLDKSLYSIAAEFLIDTRIGAPCRSEVSLTVLCSPLFKLG
jgi:pimeloyl-ACP methyl ester carboxylesterase